MKFENFESAGSKPLGIKENEKVFVNPEKEKEIISENKEEPKKDNRENKNEVIEELREDVKNVMIALGFSIKNQKTVPQITTYSGRDCYFPENNTIFLKKRKKHKTLIHELTHSLQPTAEDKIEYHTKDGIDIERWFADEREQEAMAVEEILASDKQYNLKILAELINTVKPQNAVETFDWIRWLKKGDLKEKKPRKLKTLTRVKVNQILKKSKI